jgi:pblB-like tail protein|nr:MAG TPA: tail protein [Caudoviricetes sp.]
MFNNNTSYQEAINAPSRRITGNVTIKGQKLSDDISSIDYVSSISGNTLTIGATNASTVEIKFKKLIEGLAERELIKVSFSVQTSSGIVERQIGEFFLTEIKLDRNNKTTTLKAMDKMAFLNDKYTSTLLYPTLGRNIVQEIANSCNLRVNNNLNITNLPSFSKKLEKVTYREMLGYLAQTVGAFVIFNNNGELEFRKLNRTQKQISKGSYLLKGLEVDEVEYRINGISISLNNQEKTILAVGSPLGTQVKLTNPLMTQGWLNSIFSEYSKLRFNPFKLNWRGDPFVEVGDWVSIEIANGSYRAFPILELKLSYSGGLKSTIGANVKGTTTSTTEYKGTVERQIEFINARLGASGNYVYADTVEPTNPKEGDTWFKPNGAFTDLYIYENNQWVLKTSTGNIEGLITKITDSSVSTQNLATAIAKIIELDAARITTGSLTFEQLSSNTVSEIRKGMVSETKFNSFVNDSNGLRQQMSSEIERVVESKKSTLKGQDGTSSYIHRKYSDNANGTPMSDNSNLKYIGIYTGNKQQAPTNASEYSWTKIRGEDGAKGRDGVDGKSINRNYIIDSDKLTNINSGGTNWEKTVENGTLVFTKVRATESTGIWTQIMPILKDNFQNEVLTWSVDVKASKNISFNNVGQETNGFKGRVDITTQWQRISHTFTNRYTQHYAFVFYQMIGTCSPGDKVYVRLPKLEKGNVATEWSPAYEDLRGRDGVSNYIHRKYSDSSNGANMDDNSNRKYIGIYTGTSPTPPTTASSYLWSKIKGEDGANGVPGAKGADGRTPYFHTAYSNSPTGDRDFSTINSNDKLYIGTYSDFEIADSTDYRKYKWVKIKGEDGRNGVSSYIYRKYSDNANGSPMSDNSSLKYIGIYTGTSATAPTTPSAYTWSKIKGEDGQQGVPGARGTDGRTSYLHTAYSNSATGDRDFSTTNSTNKEYIGTYTDFEINDSNDYRRYKWVKIKGENGRDGKSINENLLPNSIFNQGFAKWEDKLTNSGLNHSFDHAIANFGRGLHIWGTANADYKGLSSFPFNLVAKQGDKLTLSMDLGKDALNNNAPLLLGIHYMDDKGVIVSQQWQTLDLATQNFEVRKYKRISRVFTVQKDIRKCRVMIYATTSQLINFYIDNIKLERGEVATEWSPAYEDLQAHTLTANLRLEGTYINGVTNNVKCYLDVFYDGQKITDGFNAQIKFKGGILNTWSNFWTAKVDNTGFLTNVSWGDKEQQYPIALDVIVLVTYKDLNAVANARMENIPDVVEIKEVVKKYKTFESTLEGFTSVVGEINTKVLTKQQIRQNLSSEDVEKTGNDLYFNTKENLVANEYYTILADLDNVPANQQAYIYSASDGGDKKTIQNGLNYWVVKYTTNQTRINLYPLGTNTKVKNVRIYKGDFRIKKDDERENLYSSSATDSGDKFIHLNLIKNKINGNVYTVKFDASGYSYGDRWDIYNRIGYDENNLTQILKSKDNEFTFTINDNTTADRMYIRMKLVGNTTISNVEIYDVSTEYVKNSQVSKLESSIKQTKDEIDLKVSKDNVINSINISAEGTRIKGDLIADYLYGKTIEGAVIQGNSKIKIGKHGYMIPAGDGLRFCLPEKPDANKGVGVQMLGNYGRDGDTAYGFYLYVDPNFDTTEVAATNSYLMTVNGYISTRGVNNLKFQNYSDSSTAIGVWDKNVSLLFDRTKNDIYYEWNGKIYSIWQMVDRFYSTTSDARLKKDIRPCAYKALDLINDFKFKSFNWEHREQLEKKPFTEIGLIAQDVEKINKNFVTMAGEYKTLNQFNLLTYSLKAIQELSQENTNLKSQLKEMNERLTKLEDKINGNL